MSRTVLPPAGHDGYGDVLSRRKLLRLSADPRGVDQPDVAERLREVPDHLTAGRVDLLGQQADIVMVSDRPPGPARGRESTDPDEAISPSPARGWPGRLTPRSGCCVTDPAASTSCGWLTCQVPSGCRLAPSSKWKP